MDDEFLSHFDSRSLRKIDLSDNDLLSLGPEKFGDMPSESIRIIAYGNKFVMNFQIRFY